MIDMGAEMVRQAVPSRPAACSPKRVPVSSSGICCATVLMRAEGSAIIGVLPWVRISSRQSWQGLCRAYCVSGRSWASRNCFRPIQAAQLPMLVPSTKPSISIMPLGQK